MNGVNKILEVFKCQNKEETTIWFTVKSSNKVEEQFSIKNNDTLLYDDVSLAIKFIIK